MAAPRPALFLDRDGVINVDKSYIFRREDFEWVEGAQDVIRRFNAMGWWVFVVTNFFMLAAAVVGQAITLRVRRREALTPAPPGR